MCVCGGVGRNYPARRKIKTLVKKLLFFFVVVYFFVSVSFLLKMLLNPFQAAAAGISRELTR